MKKTITIIIFLFSFNIYAQANLNYYCVGYELVGLDNPVKQLNYNITYTNWRTDLGYQDEIITTIEPKRKDPRIIDLKYLRRMANDYKCASLNELTPENESLKFKYEYNCGPFSDYKLTGHVNSLAILTKNVKILFIYISYI